MVRKPLLGGVAVATLVLTSAGAALAVSDGGYSYQRQHCSAHADTSHDLTYAEPGCHSSTAVIYDGNGHEYGNVGLQQEPDWSSSMQPMGGGDYNVDPGSGAPVAGAFGDGTTSTSFVNPPADPMSGMNVYFGSDDNLDFGEHDNSPYGSGGPSDGGSINVHTSPWWLAPWIQALSSGQVDFHDPVPVAGGQIGAGADGHDFSVTTRREVVYQGGSTDPNRNRDVYDYNGATWDPSGCSGSTDSAQDCSPDGSHDLGYWDQQNGTTWAEPGVQVYEDPDPQGSPEPTDTWPGPAAAVTTCGVYAGGGIAALPAGTPQTNNAGQVAVRNSAC